MGTADQGGEIAEHGKSGRALDDCGETASGGAAGEIEVGQGAGIYGGSSDTIGGAVDQGDETVERNERGEAAIDGAVAAGKMGAAQGSLDDGEDDGGGTISTGAKTKPTEWAKMSKSQRTRWRRGNKK